jgi:hypothetical protein
LTSISSFAAILESARFKGEEDAFTLASERVGLEGLKGYFFPLMAYSLLSPT